VIDNRGKTPPLASHGIPLLEINSIYGEVTTPDSSKFSKYVNKEVYGNWFRCGHPVEGDILVATVGAAGATAMSDASETCIAQNIIGLRPSKSIVAEYLFQFTKSDKFKRQVKAVLMGAVQPSLKVPHLLGFNFTYPSSKKEQTLIACVLSDIGDLIGGLDQLIAKKRDIKQATMQQLLTGQQRLPGFSGEWEVKQLGELAQIVSGGTPRTSNPAYWGGDVKWCTPTDITRFSGKYLSETERSISQEGLADCSAQRLPIGSLLLCSRATIGELKIAAAEMCTNQGFKSLICNRGVSIEFLYYKLLTMKAQMVERAIGSTFLEISKKDTFGLEVYLPGTEEQTAIATILSDMDSELATLETRRDKARQLNQGMMQELLTGRIRLA
jgi:type I restriction enzyme S subunit